MASEVPTLSRPDLKVALHTFLTAVDAGAVETVFAHYHSDFCCVRTSSDGAAARLDRNTMVNFWSSLRLRAEDQGGSSNATARSTEIMLVENDGDWGVALLFREKNFGFGWEKVLYTLVWKYCGDRWLLWLEFVQQQNVPAWAKGGQA